MLQAFYDMIMPTRGYKSQIVISIYYEKKKVVIESIKLKKSFKQNYKSVLQLTQDLA